MIDLMNSQAKKPYESKTKKSMMNESSQLIVNIDNMPNGLILRESKEPGHIVQYVASKTAMAHYNT